METLQSVLKELMDAGVSLSRHLRGREASFSAVNFQDSGEHVEERQEAD